MKKKKEISIGGDNFLHSYVRDINKYSLLDKEQERNYLKKYKEKGDEESKDILFHSNLRLVIPIAKKYKHRGVSLLDLIQEGNMGLMNGIERYNHKAEIINAIYRESAEKNILCFDQARNLSRLTNLNLEKGTSLKEKIEIISKELKITEPRAKFLLEFNCSISLYQKYQNLNNNHRIEFLIDRIAQDGESPEEIFFKKENKRNIMLSLDNILEDLNERERRIIELKELNPFGIKLNNENVALILERLGYKKVTGSRVQQIEEDAWRKLRKNINPPKDYLYD